MYCTYNLGGSSEYTFIILSLFHVKNIIYAYECRDMRKKLAIKQNEICIVVHVIYVSDVQIQLIR